MAEGGGQVGERQAVQAPHSRRHVRQAKKARCRLERREQHEVVGKEAAGDGAVYGVRRVTRVTVCLSPRRVATR